MQDNPAYSTADALQDNPAYNHIVQGEDDAEYTYARIDEFIGLNDEQEHDDYIWDKDSSLQEYVKTLYLLFVCSSISSSHHLCPKCLHFGVA